MTGPAQELRKSPAHLYAANLGTEEGSRTFRGGVLRQLDVLTGAVLIAQLDAQLLRICKRIMGVRHRTL